MDKYLERIEVLIGKNNIKKLKKKKVLVCGVGGVGSFVAEALARSGIGYLTIVDYDVIDSSNLNRQLMTNKNNIGKNKVEALKERLESISNCKVEAINTYIDESFKLKKYDYVIDCIDSLKSKFSLVKKCHKKGIPVLSSLGSAKRIKIENIKRTTLDKTQNDPLAKAFRTLAKKERYQKKIDVVFVDSAPIKCDELGSSIFVVGSVGLFIAQQVFADLLKESNYESNNKQTQQHQNSIE